MSTSILRRVVRRESHSPRTAWAVIVLLLVVAAIACAGVEIVLHLMDAAPILVAPGAALSWAAALPETAPRATLIGGGAVAVVVGLGLGWVSVTPGRRPRHRLGASPHAVLADNSTIASAVAEQVRRDLDLPRGAVVVGLGHRSMDVTVTPEPGQVIEKEQIRSAAEREITSYELSPRVRVRARVRRPAADQGGMA